jgi:protein involved in polysaccharide export with SLBB domain
MPGQRRAEARGGPSSQVRTRPKSRLPSVSDNLGTAIGSRRNSPQAAFAAAPQCHMVAAHPRARQSTVGIKDGGLVMLRSLSFGALLGIGLLVTGCATYGPVAVSPEPISVIYASTKVQAGDKIKVTVYGEDNLNGIYDIDPAGNVSLPLAGTVRAAGRTKRDLERIITGRYKSDFLQDPKVTVDIVLLRPFYVMGEAERNGEFQYRTGLNVMGAIATAGGLTYRASRHHLFIQHAGNDYWTQYPIEPSIAIAPGDVIRIPERYF